MENKEKGKSNDDNKQEGKEKHLVMEGKKTTGETRYALHLKYEVSSNIFAQEKKAIKSNWIQKWSFPEAIHHIPGAEVLQSK